LNSPVILLQGDEDAIVPPNQAEKMYSALQGKNIPSTLVAVVAVVPKGY
jgi:dipeptidyl aminopeptidase/acylaminoacyl peptidase